MGGEAGAAATAQSRRLDLGDEGLGFAVEACRQDSRLREVERRSGSGTVEHGPRLSPKVVDRADFAEALRVAVALPKQFRHIGRRDIADPTRRPSASTSTTGSAQHMPLEPLRLTSMPACRTALATASAPAATAAVSPGT